MSEPTGGTGTDDDEPTVVDHTTSRSGGRARWSRKAQDEDEDEVQHRALVGFMSVPVHRRFPIRRSTLVLVVAFLGLGTVLYFNPPESDTVGKGAVVNGYFVPGAVPVSTTTTTTSPPPTTTVPPASTTSTRAPTSTTTGPLPTSTTLARGSTTTTTSVPASGTGGGAGSTTTTGAQVGATGSTGPATTGP